MPQASKPSAWARALRAAAERAGRSPEAASGLGTRQTPDDVRQDAAVPERLEFLGGVHAHARLKRHGGAIGPPRVHGDVATRHEPGPGPVEIEGLVAGEPERGGG